MLIPQLPSLYAPGISTSDRGRGRGRGHTSPGSVGTFINEVIADEIVR